MNKYKINLHAHTIFSDGSNSPYVMAVEAKRLGLSALAITDHYYPSHPKEWCSSGAERHRLTRRACVEAKDILPIIVGMELAFGEEEMLVYGTKLIQEIHRHCDKGNELTIDLLIKLKRRHESAFILCHPGNPEKWEALLPILDGYERYNSGQDMFGEHREVGVLGGLPSWCNSDAHSKEGLSIAYNLTTCKIETEEDIIKYIREGNRPSFYVDKRLKP
jgi:hypothetical protein